MRRTLPRNAVGKRVVFASVDDGSGPLANVVFFSDAQDKYGGAVFHTHYMLVRGKTRRSGAKGVSVTGDDIWDLLDVAVKVRDRKRKEAGVVEQPAANVTQLFARGA